MFQVRERLVSQDVNRESLLAIDSSIGLFSIEDETPKVGLSLWTNARGNNLFGERTSGVVKQVVHERPG